MADLPPRIGTQFAFPPLELGVVHPFDLRDPRHIADLPQRQTANAVGVPGKEETTVDGVPVPLRPVPESLGFPVGRAV